MIYFLGAAVLGCLILLGVILSEIWRYPPSTFTVPETETPRLFINGEESMPPFSWENSTYEAPFLTTLEDTVIEVNGVKKRLKLPFLKNTTAVHFTINHRDYFLKTLPHGFPLFKVDKTPQTPAGYLALTPYSYDGLKAAHILLISTDGDVLFYRRAPLGTKFSDFKKTVLDTGTSCWTYMQQTEPFRPDQTYFLGELNVLDAHFRPLKKVRFLPYDTHPALPIENHESLMLGDNHFILTSYQRQEILDPKTQNPVRITAPIIQEQKDGQVVMEWNGAQDALLIEKSLHPHLTPAAWTDFFHLNSVLIDPKDGHLLLSGREISSVVKIDRKTGKVLWILGGKGDEFNLKPEQFFIGQHTLSWADEDTLMLFDNNATHSFNRTNKPFPAALSPVSRILTFTLNQKDKKVIDFKALPLSYQSGAMGNVYKTPFGFVVGYGDHRPEAVHLLDANGKILSTLYILNDLYSYKAYYYATLK